MFQAIILCITNLAFLWESSCMGSHHIISDLLSVSLFCHSCPLLSSLFLQLRKYFTEDVHLNGPTYIVSPSSISVDACMNWGVGDVTLYISCRWRLYSWRRCSFLITTVVCVLFRWRWRRVGCGQQLTDSLWQRNVSAAAVAGCPHTLLPARLTCTLLALRLQRKVIQGVLLSSCTNDTLRYIDLL